MVGSGSVGNLGARESRVAHGGALFFPKEFVHPSIYIGANSFLLGEARMGPDALNDCEKVARAGVDSLCCYLFRWFFGHNAGVDPD